MTQSCTIGGTRIATMFFIKNNDFDVKDGVILIRYW